MSKRKLNVFGVHGLAWSGLRERDKANEKRTNLWAGIWIVSLLIAGASTRSSIGPEWLGWTIGGLSLIPGALLVMSYLRLLREADELLRKIQLEALAIGFGAGFVCGMTAMLLTPPSEIWGMAAIIPMILGYVGWVTRCAYSAVRDDAEAGE